MIQTFAGFSFSALPIHSIVLLGFYVAVAVYVLFTAIIYYHWNEFSTDAGVSKITLVAYFGTTLPILAIAGVMVLVI